MTTHDGAPRGDEWPMQPAGTDTMPIEPPPSGLASDADSELGTSDWQARYESEQRRSRIFMVTSALLGAGLLASLVFAAAQAQSGVSSPAVGDRPFGVPGMGHGHHGFDDRGFRGDDFDGDRFGDSGAGAEQGATLPG